ncbi:beta-N-acetylhexosaminidase [Actinorhabdospora filicis]|uniref:Beta-N-acetylhexosaminidase n=1 Tax=Actinorhabdospora filicis TaxID=1785913 RepID=A0A9W6SPQ7_9ACTN|nr:glycoside hydrolase family 3 N-terminal domain-containing protein [Actinorhabdospora filicis]GLZ79740.1 beta-N-acetylhexosaminidase [Actinorhabdospora filicis]
MLFAKLSRRSLLISSCAAALAACSRKEEPRAPASSSPSPEFDPAAMVSAMTDEELLGLVLMPHAFGHEAEDVTDASKAANRAHAGVDTPAEMVRKYHLSGLILMRFSAEDPTAGTNPTSNLDSPEQIGRLTSGLQKAAGDKLPLIIGIDQEFGAVTRITSGISALPAAMGFGAAADPGLTERAWRGVGGELMRLGINADFAPTADVLANQGNTVIGSRSYGSDPAAVAAQVTAVLAGLSGAGLAGAVKHFPGHGNTDVDSHQGLPELDQPKAQLLEEDLVPFKAAFAAGVPMVMSGHLDVRAIDPGVPASLSKKVLVDLLRGELGFKGVCITDAFQMAPITERYGPREASLQGLLAGNDLILMPENVTEAYAGLKEALKDGRLPRERLVEAATRVVALRQWLKTHANGGAELGSAAPVAAEIAHAAVTQVAGCGQTVSGPVRLTGGADATRERLAKALKERGVAVSASAPTTVQLTGFLDTAADVDPRAEVTVSTDTPYNLANVDSRIRLAAFGTTSFSMDAVADVLTGRAKATGHLPVPVKGVDDGC